MPKSESLDVSFDEAAKRAGVSTATLRRWVGQGLIPQYSGQWNDQAIAHARAIARLRARGHSLDEIRSAAESGRLASSSIEDLLGSRDRYYSLDEVSRQTGLEPALLLRLLSAFGVAEDEDGVSESNLQLLHRAAVILGAGFPLVALLQVARVYSQALAQIADAEVRLFHLYVHEPMMRDGVPMLEMADSMNDLAAQVLPLVVPVLDRLHQHYLRHYLAQDVVGHMEDLDDETLDLGRMRVAIAFADLTGYTRLTEEQGDEEALSAVERFVEAVEQTLPDEFRILKTIGDEVMIVGADPSSLIDWAVGFQSLYRERPLPRIGLHYGQAIYRDGDYFGREINMAARVATRAAGGEVLATRSVVEQAGAHLSFEMIGEVKLKGFTEATEIFIARRADAF